MLDFSNPDLFRIARVKWLRCFPVLKNFLWNTFTETLSLNQEERVICEGCRTDIKKEKQCTMQEKMLRRTLYSAEGLTFSTKSPDEFSAHDFLPQRTVDLWLHFSLTTVRPYRTINFSWSWSLPSCHLMSDCVLEALTVLVFFAASFFWFDFRFLKEESPLYSSKNFNTVC